MPVQADKFPTSIEDAVAFTKLEPPKDYPELEIYDRYLNQLRIDYCGVVLIILEGLFKGISSDSIEDTERKIDIALEDLSELAPVQWVLERKSKKNLRDGSCSYQLIRLELFINPNGAFAIYDQNKMVWLEQASKYGKAFSKPR